MESTTAAILDYGQQPIPQTPKPPTHGGDFEKLFQMLEELGPAPNDFMLWVDEPVLTRENIFEDFD